MSDKINIARIKKFGHNFEISVDPDKALDYKNGKINDLSEVLLADKIFTDAKKGFISGQKELEEAFKTLDTNKIAEMIIKHGEIQATSEHRSAEREQKFRKLVNMIYRNAVDPKTGLPHPAARIEAALEQGKIQLDYNKTVEEQFDDIVSKLRPIIPIKIEQKKLTVVVPSQYSGKLYQFVKNNSKTLKEDWLSNGDWKVVIEIPAGLAQEIIEKLNSMTHGEVVVEMK